MYYVCAVYEIKIWSTKIILCKYLSIILAKNPWMDGWMNNQSNYTKWMKTIPNEWMDQWNEEQLRTFIDQDRP